MRAADLARELEAIIVVHGNIPVFASHVDVNMTLVRPVVGLDTEVIDGERSIVIETP